MNRFLAYLLALLLLAAASAPATAQHVGMVQSAHHSSSYLNARLATDPAGNTYYAGCFQNQVDIAGTVLTSPVGDSSVNLYFAKFDAGGQLLWVNQGGSPTLEVVYAIAYDGAGSVYVAGTSGPGADFGSAHIDSTGSFLLKLDAATGNMRWARVIGHSTVSPYPNSQPIGVLGWKLVATSTDVYVGGYIYDNSALDNIPLYNGRRSTAFVARCTPGGSTTPGTVTAVWQCVPSADTLARSVLNGFQVSATGEVVVIGGYRGTVRFGAEPSAPTSTSQVLSSGDDNFIARITLSATGGNGELLLDHLPRLITLVLDTQANCYFTGTSLPGARIGPVVATDTALFVARFDPTPGAGVRWVDFTHSSSLANTFIDLKLHPGSGRLYGCGRLFTGHLQFGTYSIDNPSAFVVSYDTSGIVQWARAFNAAGTTLNIPMGLDVDSANRVFMAGYALDAFGLPPLTYDGLAIRPNSAYLLRLDPAAEVNGTVYLDQNANGLRDSAESGFPRPVVVQEVSGTGGHLCISGPTGLYHALLPAGSFDLEAVPPLYYTVSYPQTNRQSGTLAGVGTVVSGRDFGLAPLPNRTDVRVTLTAYTRARRGFANRYRARVENLGTVPASGSVVVQLDSAVSYLGATPVPAQQANNAATWNFQNLAPFGVLDYDVTATMSLNVPLQTPLTSSATATVSGDLDTTNNADLVQQFVVGSFDPNDLTVNYTSLTPAQVAAGTVLDYVVRFQNMGTDTAFTVVITDTLAAQLLQLGTLQLVGQSHNCWWNILGNNNLVVRFDNINLPPNATNALGSAGFVRFQVTPRATLTPGALIPNTAHIVFDYNAPLATNGVTTLVQCPTGLPRETGGATWSFYPNPATSRVTLTADVLTPGAVQVVITDALGRLMRQESVAAPTGEWRHAVSVAGLTPGLYAVRLTLPDGASTSRRLVVQ